MIQIRMREIVELKLPRQQFGCRPGHSTAQALMRLLHYAGITAGTNRQFGAILYDFTKAYDRVPKHILIDKMLDLDIPAYLVRIVHQWLTDRTFTVTYRNTESTIRPQANGIPQGSSLSVLLWIIFVYDIPLDPSMANTYVDNTIGWAIGCKKSTVIANLEQQLKCMLEWCRINKIKINTDKTHVLFNEYNPQDVIQVDNVKITTTKTIRYLGAELTANEEDSHSTFLIGTEQIAKNIIKRCKAIKCIRKYKIPEKTFRQACHAFIGGMFNFYTPWIGAELAIKWSRRPLEVAYNEFMRTYSGCIRSTPIPLLYAITRFPLLDDKVMTCSVLTVLKAEAQDNILGQDYRIWDSDGCQADGWTPFGKVRNAIERKAKQYESKVHPPKLIPSHILEHLARCQFHLSDRETAIEQHNSGKLIPLNPDIAIWTDGSLNREKVPPGLGELIDPEDQPTSGAAAIVYISDPDPHSTLFALEIHSTLLLDVITSSYEAEVIAIQSGLDIISEMNIEGRRIHLFTDSLSCLQQLACLPYKYQYTNAVVVDIADKLANLADENEVELHFVPSHTKLIPQSDLIDELAKQAATDGDLIDHDPFLTSYRLTFKKFEKYKLRKYLSRTVKASHFRKYPNREPLRDGYFMIKSSAGNVTVSIDSSNPLLNRVRTGHTRARTHLKNIGIESDNTCRHCNRRPESIKHQLLTCKTFKKKFKKLREEYKENGIEDFNKALYTHETFMKKFLTTAYKYGCYI